MKFIHKIGIGLVTLLFAFSMGVPSYAQNATSTSSAAEQISQMLQLIADLQEQLAELQAQQNNVRQEIKETIQLTRSLSRGMSGDDVEELQKLLASDPDIYPEGLVTGYYGTLTERAVERLQEKFGIETVGIVGPQTRGTINQLFKNLNRGKGSLNRGPGNIFDALEVDDEEDADLSEFTPGTTGILVCHMPRGNRAAAHTIAVGGPAVQAHLAHGDTLGSCDGDEIDEDEEEDEDEDNSEEDTTPPVISDVESNISSTTVTITWNTDEDSNSTVWYSLNSGFDLDDDDVEEESESDDTMSHTIEIGLDDLTALSTYYFIVGSEDDEGNNATSTQDSFETN